MSAAPMHSPARVRSRRDDVRVGKDMLELVSMAMYVDPLSIYREYVQNAADAIDEAVLAGLLENHAAGQIELEIDVDERRIRIRDNGTGVLPEQFVPRMVALGGSEKRGRSLRGFRGVGRLAGLGCAQELVFRSRAAGQADVSEMRWDGRRLKAALADHSFSGDAASLIGEVVSVGSLSANGYPAHFFEVELLKVIRQRNDKLMDVHAVSDYLSQVAPVPFAADFPYGEAVVSRVREVTPLSELSIAINDGEPLTRPHKSIIALAPGKESTWRSHEVIEIPGIDGGLAAIAWIAHHDYVGALPVAALVKGLRLRIGNLQVGDHSLLEDIFPEVRFSGWSVGEVHVLDPRILPNGRRDNLEQNAHFTNLLNQLTPIAKRIGTVCRTNSARRSKTRQLELAAAELNEHIASLKKGGLSKAGRTAAIDLSERLLERMDRVARQREFDEGEQARLAKRVANSRTRLSSALEVKPSKGPLDHFSPKERAAYERVFELIFKYLPDASAKTLVERLGNGLVQRRAK